MLLIPQKGQEKQITNLSTTASGTPGTIVTTGGTAATKGSAFELISAANNIRDSYGIYIEANAYGGSAAACEGALDILGGAATEEVLIPDLLMGYCGNAEAGRVKSWFFPLYIPAGTRISARAAGARVNTTVRVGATLLGGTMPPWRIGGKITTYGMGTVPNGTAITPVVGAPSTTQIVASTTADHFAFLPSFQVAVDTTLLAKQIVIGIGVGAATEDLIGSWTYYCDANEFMSGPAFARPVFYSVPSGSRLVMRASATGTLESNYNGVIHAMS